jgi:anti-sigma regulatory factor (Ser/Thr protein kinase)
MPTFLSEIDTKFNSILRKNNISKNDILELKSSIIEAYENDTIMDIRNLQKKQTVLTLDLYNV